MTVEIKLADGHGDPNHAKITHIGQLVVAPYAYDLVESNELAEPDTAYNFYKPVANWQFIITGIVAKADKQVSNQVDAAVIIYESEEVLSTTIDKVIFPLDMVEGDLVTLGPLNIIINEGKFINAKTTDDDIHMTITGYYIPKVAG